MNETQLIKSDLFVKTKDEDEDENQSRLFT